MSYNNSSSTIYKSPSLHLDNHPTIYSASSNTAGLGAKSYKNILDKRQFHINHTSTTEGDPDPHCAEQ
jgi:hypothetical protein